MQNIAGQTQLCKLEAKPIGNIVYALVYKHTGLDHKHIRITNGYKEVRPSNEPIECKQGDKLEVKLRILGGGRESNIIDSYEDKRLIENVNSNTN